MIISHQWLHNSNIQQAGQQFSHTQVHAANAAPFSQQQLLEPAENGSNLSAGAGSVL
jgi:hypothetical protein